MKKKIDYLNAKAIQMKKRLDLRWEHQGKGNTN